MFRSYLKRTRVLLVFLSLALLWALPATTLAAPQPAKIFLVALDDGGQSGQLFGCNDSLIPVNVQIDSADTTEARIKAALERLFSIKDQFYGESGLYTALSRANLSVDSVTITGSAALVQLSGSLSLGGECDDPRAREQIMHTITQFNGVEGATVLLNGDLLLPGQNERCFDVTGHCVRGDFLRFWNENGGLAVFGYPLSDLIVENGRAVQYFERQRFEYHPENEPPFDILLGLLGDTAAQQRGLLGTAPFQPVSQAGTPSQCLYFPETQHRVCFGFRSYWQSHGLNFGDPGTSFRESLMLFGYPISEEFTDPQTGLTVQYFERARFEWHPENAAPWDILLERLGANLYGR